jgi:hypothetical protein
MKRIRKFTLPKRRLGVCILLSIVSVINITHAQAQTRCSHDRALYRIRVDDAVEAELIQQELKIVPEGVRDNWFYYYGNARLNKILRQYDYHPALQNPDDFFTRIVRISPARREEELRKSGVLVLLRESRYWIVRVSQRQLRQLSSRGFGPHSIGEHDLQPRQLRLFVPTLHAVQQAASLGMDIYVARPEKRGYVITGGALDDVIDRLRAAGLPVEILPDVPGVTR